MRISKAAALARAKTLLGANAWIRYAPKHADPNYRYCVGIQKQGPIFPYVEIIGAAKEGWLEALAETKRILNHRKGIKP